MSRWGGRDGNGREGNVLGKVAEKGMADFLNLLVLIIDVLFGGLM